MGLPFVSGFLGRPCFQ